jgi:hypothetical protein
MTCIVCRYNHPYSALGASILDDDGITYARTVGSEYLNPAPLQIISLTKSNSDLRFLRGPAVDYSTKYTSKPQGVIDNDKLLEAIARAFVSRNRAERENPDFTPDQIGKARARSLMYNTTNYTQIDATLAAFFLARKGGAFIFTHKVAHLGLYSLMSIVQSSAVTVTLVPGKDGGATSSLSATRYIQRQERHLALFEFFLLGLHERSNSRKRKKNKSTTKSDSEDSTTTTSDSETETSSLRSDDTTHPGCPSSPSDRVVVIHGFSFKPAIRRTTAEKEAEHALAALICFVPFDTLDANGIMRGKPNYQEALQDAEAANAICPVGLKYLANVEKFWALKLNAQERTKERNRRQKQEADADEQLKASSTRPSSHTEENHYHDSDDDQDYVFDDDDDGANIDLLVETPNPTTRNGKQDYFLLDFLLQ